jgi:long-chain fatty acid transport protein
MKNQMTFRFPLPRFLMVSAALVGSASAVGFRLPNQDPEGIARGNAFSATADNPSAIYYNPAGITQLDGTQVSIGVYAISTNVNFVSDTGDTASTVPDPQAVPQIYFVHSPENSSLSYGLGIYSPYGLGIDYAGETPFPTLAEEGSLLYGTVNPVIAWQISKTLSVAAGVTLNYSKIDISRTIGLMPGDEFEFEGDDFDAGFNLGVLWQPSEQWSFGLNYRSETKMSYEGESRAYPYSGGESRTSGEVTFPYFIVGGVSYRPNKYWNFEFNLDWTDWDSVNDTLLKGTFGGDQVFPFRYQSSFMYNFGITRSFDSGYFISAGYIYSENSIPNETLSPLNPDAALHLGSIGFGHRGETVSWALGYHFAYNGGRKVSGNQTSSFLGETANGEFKIFNHAVNVSMRYHF